MQNHKLQGMLVAFVATAGGTAPAHATFHFMQIERVIGGVYGDTTAQAIQLRMRISFQQFVTPSRIRAWDAAGQNPIVVIDLNNDVANGSRGDRILIASPNFANFTNPPAIADFIMTNLIPATYLAGGSLTYETDDGNIIYWRLSWGNYAGSNLGDTTNDSNGNFGPPWPGPLPSSDLQALSFQGPPARSSTNAADYALTGGPAVFTNNARVSFNEPAISVSLELVAGGPSAAVENAGSGLTAPVFLTHAGDGSGRLFVVDQVGQIRIIKNGTLLATPFLDLTSKIVTINAFFDERGVLGLAFHPEYANNGRFFVRYSAPRAGDPNERCNDPEGFVVGCHEEILAEYTVSGDPDVADPTSEIILYRVDEPEFNHDAGQVMFGPDGLLYWTLGDGGGGNDDLHLDGLCDAGHCAGDASVCSVSAQDCVDLSACVTDEGYCSVPDGACADASSCVASGTTPHGPIGNGQNKDTPLGSLLRIDVDSTPDEGMNYKIPPGNPFAGGGGTPEIYAYGLRNPYRFSFATVGASDVAIVGDVGQALFEEIDFIPISDTPGLLNYGWATREGFSCFDPFDVITPPSTCSTTGPSGETLLDPEVDYPHPMPCATDAECAALLTSCNSEGFCANPAGIAVIGGFVYRGSAYPPLAGKYFFGDFGQSFAVPGGRLFYMDVEGPDPFVIREVFISPGGDPLGLAVFGIGEDEAGELYVLTADSIGPIGNGFITVSYPRHHPRRDLALDIWKSNPHPVRNHSPLRLHPIVLPAPRSLSAYRLAGTASRRWGIFPRLSIRRSGVPSSSCSEQALSRTHPTWSARTSALRRPRRCHLRLQPVRQSTGTWPGWKTEFFFPPMAPLPL